MMFNEVWRLALTTLALNSCLLELCCGFKQTLSHMCTYTYIFIHTHRGLPVSVFWSGADRVSVVGQGSVTHMLSLYVVLTGLLWSASLWPNTICYPKTPILSSSDFLPLCIFPCHHTPKNFFSCPFQLSSSMSFNISNLLLSCVLFMYI